MPVDLFNAPKPLSSKLGVFMIIAMIILQFFIALLLIYAMCLIVRDAYLSRRRDINYAKNVYTEHKKRSL